MTAGDHCRRCKVELRLEPGTGRYFQVNGERVELRGWSVWQCPTCKRITLTIEQLASLARFVEAGE